ncbi:hypothetical protein FOL47_002178, partial [Perkinsus chesapeaki]
MLLSGMLKPMDSSGHGQGDDKLASICMARGMLIATVLSTLLFGLLQLTEVLLTLLGQNPIVANHAMRYVNSASIGIWPAIQFDCIMRFLLCYHHPHICTWIYAITSSLHVLWCYILVTPQSGLAGAGVAMAITYSSTLLLGLGFTWSMFRGWWDYLKIGIPSMITMCSEWWAYEIATLVIGLLHDSNQLAAHVSICNIFVI